MRAGSRRAARGFTYLWLLAAMAVVGIAMAAVGPVWATQAQREREAELIRVGEAYARAIEHYRAMTPRGASPSPRSVDDLLADPRFAAPVRHLRSAYTDPLQPGRPLEPVLDATGGLAGVRSTSTLEPLLRVAWTDGTHTLAPAPRYCDWQFLAQISP
jgi:type II secretory pathway pseudopilin PulG